MYKIINKKSQNHFPKKLTALALASLVASAVTGCSSDNSQDDTKQQPEQFSINLKQSAQLVFSAEDPEGAAEIVTFDASNGKLFVVNSLQQSVDVMQMAEGNWSRVANIDISMLGDGANSVSAHNGRLAIAIEVHDDLDSSRQMPGKVALFDSNTYQQLDSVTVGYLPDMLTFTPDGTKILVANEGEPSDNYQFDPVGSVSIIDSETLVVTQLGFEAFNLGGSRANQLPAGVRFSGPGASVAQDLEPEYIAVSEDSRQAWVVMQENNAMARINLESPNIEAIFALGTKDYGLEQNAIDASDKDDAYQLQARANVVGMYMPDGIDVMTVDGKPYVLTANEGDSREYFFEVAGADDDEKEANCLSVGGMDYDDDDGCLAFTDEIRAKDLGDELNTAPVAANLAEATDGKNSPLGRLKVSTVNGVENGEVTTLHSFGARSFSIFNGETGELVWDSGNQFATELQAFYDDNSLLICDEGKEVDCRSDDKGVEPESVVVGEIDGRRFAFIGLERAGGVMVYDVTDPQAPEFIQYQPGFAEDSSKNTVKDIAPEGLKFIPAEQSPTDKNLLVISNEVSGTTSIMEIEIK